MTKTYIKYDLEGNLLEEIKSTTVLELSKTLGSNLTSLHDHLKGRNLSCNNFQIKELTSDRVLKKIGSVYQTKTGVKSQPILKRFNGRVIATYKDANEASIKNNIAIENINSSIQMGSKTNEFNFEFIK